MARFFKQTLLGPEDGNCFQAALAGMLGLSIEQVPHFYGRDNSRGKSGTALLNEVRDFLYPLGWDLLSISLGENIRPPRGLCIAGGESPGYDGAEHVAVYKDGMPYYDPSPSNQFIKGKPEIWWVLIPLDPINCQCVSDRVYHECKTEMRPFASPLDNSVNGEPNVYNGK